MPPSGSQAGTGAYQLAPANTPIAERQRLQKEGFVTLTALDNVDDIKIEARRVGCSHALIGGAVVALAQ